jgi:pantetheine-phosphate adenylyltransferase
VQKYKYAYAVLGGTFDRFHVGHKKLITTAFAHSEKVGIGVATHQLYEGKLLSHAIESYDDRIAILKLFLKSENLLNRTDIIPIDDIYGNTLTKKDIHAIFVTKDSLPNAKKINAKRKELGLPPLAIQTVDFYLGLDGLPLSSTRIRSGETDRTGNDYFGLFSKKKRLILPDDLRERLRIPLGKVIKNIRDVKKYIDSNSLLITIGDMVTVNLFMENIRSDVAIFDYLTRRHKITEEYHEMLQSLSKSSVKYHASNPSGTIERRAVGVIRKAIHVSLETDEKQIIEIEGEEDLLTIPAILLSPLGSIVLYGQTGVGTVVVKVTEKKKKEVMNLLRRFI